MVQLSGANHLTLAEVEVFGGPRADTGGWVGTWATAMAGPARGIKVIGATLTPFKGRGGYDAEVEAPRTGINEFVRTSGVFDGVADFAAALADPRDPLSMKPEFSAGDHLHPADAGNEAMVAALDLAEL
ncbi:hypothetical protein [Amycolatopsis sp. H20-H5]|uniref:hypothetical protein n=1 Tax=Amycolatopsis sp. H20-H5 TaxID=3046309 RepID=UPI002DBFD7D8|nr:hypothetical protein [Amycolatopsis sp. H20-H5]MEC3982820.1 hypothetical protein [Amycolatopsis sp. H20-H5]